MSFLAKLEATLGFDQPYTPLTNGNVAEAVVLQMIASGQIPTRFTADNIAFNLNGGGNPILIQGTLEWMVHQNLLRGIQAEPGQSTAFYLPKTP